MNIKVHRVIMTFFSIAMPAVLIYGLFGSLATSSEEGSYFGLFLLVAVITLPVVVGCWIGAIAAWRADDIMDVEDL